jgi:hypothetical protein
LKKIIGDLGCIVLSLAMGCILMSGAASAASILYDNTVSANTGQVFGWSVDMGDNFDVSDSFTLGTDALVTSINFTVWLNPGDSLSTINWAITPASVSDTTTLADVTTVAAVGTADFGTYDVYEESIAVNANLTAGVTYWLQFQDAQTSALGGSTPGDFVGWDESDGNSQAVSDVLEGGVPDPSAPLSGSLANINCSPCTGSETFQIIGTTPEPGTVTMLLSGFFLLAGTALFKTRRDALRRPLPQPARIQPRN